MTAPLARDAQNNPFDLPATAAFWRVRRHTGGRPSTVLGPDGEPLFLPIDAERADLRANGCNGSLRLEAVDAEQHSLALPVAFVELGVTDEAPVSAPRSSEQPDLVRFGFESMTRTMEAMQRAQVERERALVQREKSITDAQLATTKMHGEFMSAVLERLGGGKPQDPLSVVKQQFALQKVFAEGARNAGLLASPESVRPESVDHAPQETEAGWLQSLKSAWPVVAPGLQQVLFATYAKDDPAKQAIIQQMMNAGGGALSAQTANAPVDDAHVVSAPYPKVIRQILAELDDPEAEAFEAHLDNLDVGASERLSAEVARVANHERCAWARALLRNSSASDTMGVFSVDVPQDLMPLLAQLSQDELHIGAQIFAALDVASTERLFASLRAMSPDQAVGTMRTAIADARRRSASIAHRAVATALGQNGAAS